MASTGSPCWEWAGYKDKDGYGIVRIDRRPVRTHRVAWQQYYERPVPVGYLVCHHCDNPPCINPEHLYVGTHRDNAVDRERRGRGFNPTKKLTESDVRRIRTLYDNTTLTLKQLAEQHGVTWGQVGHIVNRRTWQGVL